MKERPILFSGPMVRAIREGRKTQTRRVIKPQPPEQPLPNCHPNHSAKHPSPYLDSYCSELKTPTNPRGMGDRWCWWQVDDRQCLPTFRCPYGQPGDRLWVRETFRSKQQCGETIDWTYRADCPALTEYLFPWKPSIFMPRQASRITLEIVGVRVERLQDISEEDAKAEGCEWSQWSFPNSTKPGKSAYRALWESINGPGSWDLNPWVWVVEFKEVKP